MDGRPRQNPAYRPTHPFPSNLSGVLTCGNKGKYFSQTSRCPPSGPTGPEPMSLEELRRSGDDSYSAFTGPADGARVSAVLRDELPDMSEDESGPVPYQPLESDAALLCRPESRR